MSADQLFDLDDKLPCGCAFFRAWSGPQTRYGLSPCSVHARAHAMLKLLTEIRDDLPNQCTNVVYRRGFIADVHAAVKGATR